MEIEYAVDRGQTSSGKLNVISTPALMDQLYGFTMPNIVGAGDSDELETTVTKKTVNGDFVVTGRILIKQNGINRVVIGNIDT